MRTTFYNGIFIEMKLHFKYSKENSSQFNEITLAGTDTSWLANYSYTNIYSYEHLFNTLRKKRKQAILIYFNRIIDFNFL